MFNPQQNFYNHPPKTPLFDEDGFLIEPKIWTQQLAEELANAAGISQLTDPHWHVINHIRNKYFAIGALPNMRLICRAMEMSKAEIYALFGGCLIIWRIAGLPNPGEEAKTYMS